MKIKIKSVKRTSRDVSIWESSLHNLASNYSDQGLYKKQNLYYLKRALKIREKDIGPEHPDSCRNTK